jgi:hypothetical protein
MGNCCGGEEDNQDMTVTGKPGKKGTGVGSGGFQEESDSNIYDFCNSKVKSIFNELDTFNIPALNDNVNTQERPLKVLDNEARYLGEWNEQSNERHGRGVQVWHDGSMYEGQWKNDKANGKGRLIHADGDVYEGDWLDDKAHG